MSSGRVSAICNGVREPSPLQPACANVEIGTPPQIAAVFLRPLLHINECSPSIERDDFTIEDAKTFTKPWTASQLYKLKPGWEIAEYTCDNNKYTYPPEK